MNTESIDLSQQVSIPKIGLGTWQLTGDDGYQAVKTALDVGYRHIDTAYHYGNHEQVGKAIADSSVDREDVFLTTKIWRDHLTEDKLKSQFQESLQQLDTDYVDLLLVHWPNQSVPIEETLSAMETLQDEGRIEAIGVSNFTNDLLSDALDTGVDTVVNQVEYHPSLNQSDHLEFCRENDVTVTAYSPLGRGQDIELDAVQSVAGEINATESQVIISWLNQKGIVAIPKASSRAHLQENLEAGSVTLSDEQMKKLDQCDRGNRLIVPAFAPFNS